MLMAQSHFKFPKVVQTHTLVKEGTLYIPGHSYQFLCKPVHI